MEVNLTGQVRSDAALAGWIAHHGLDDVASLVLWGAELTDSAARTLAEAEPRQLLALDLSWNHLGPGGAEVLARELPGIERLRLYHNDLGPDGAAAIGRGGWALAALNLCGNALGDSGCGALAGSLRGLRELALGWNGLSRPLEPEDWPLLTQLNIRANALDGDAAAALLALPSLLKLGLDENALGTDGLRAVVEAEGFERLEWLNLGGTGLDDRAVEVLASAAPRSALRELRVHDNELSLEGCLALRAAFPLCEVRW